MAKATYRGGAYRTETGRFASHQAAVRSAEAERTAKAPKWTYHKVVVVEHFAKGPREAKEIIEVRTTVYGRSKDGDGYAFARRARDAGRRQARREGYEVTKGEKKKPNPAQVESFGRGHKGMKKDWQHEQRESGSKVGRNHTEHYNHKIYDPASHKFVDVEGW